MPKLLTVFFPPDWDKSQCCVWTAKRFLSPFFLLFVTGRDNLVVITYDLPADDDGGTITLDENGQPSFFSLSV